MKKATKKMLKARKKMNKAISAQLVPFGIRKARYTGEYSYHFDKNIIDYKVSNNDIEDEWFRDFLKDRFNYTVKSDFIISILHELGHAKANEEIDGAIYDFCQREKMRINVEMMCTDDETVGKSLCYQYFNLPDEIMATQWAVDYAETHEEELQEMLKKITPAIKKYQKKLRAI